MTSFSIGQKIIDIFPGGADAPVVFLHTFGHEGAEVWQQLQDRNPGDFSLVAIGGLEWDRDMAPWDAPPISAGDTPCTGGADAHLKTLLNEILPRAEAALPGKPAWRGLAGYSLAGLFAVYAMYQTDVFSRIATMSGSLWFPGIKEYVFSHTPVKNPACIYLSLGDKEAKVRNKFLRTVQENTEQIAAYYQNEGIQTMFCLNPGNHYRDAARRTAAGIAWILKDGRRDVCLSPLG